MAHTISEAVARMGVSEGVVADLFAGTGAVARAFKRAGYSVIAGDLLVFPYTLQRVYIQMSVYPAFTSLLPCLDATATYQPRLFPPPDAARHESSLERVIKYLNDLPGCNGFISRNYTQGGTKGSAFIRTYFTDGNGQRIDAVFEKIREWQSEKLLSEDEYYLLLAAALEAVPRVANILGTFGAFKKGDWEARALKPYLLIPPRLISSPHFNRAFHGSANDLIGEIACDLLYLDPPYNNRQYAEYYHLLETLAEGTEPEIGGLTGKPLGPRRLSRYCTRTGAQEQLTDIVLRAQTRHIFLSYSDDGLLTADEITQILSHRGVPSEPFKLAEHRRYRSDRDRDEEGDRKRKYQEHDTKTVDEWLYHVAITR